MRYGVYLMGGGAKGAFQAGLLYALNERGMKWKSMGGTSIGAINGYMVLKNGFERMKELYNGKGFTEDFMDQEISGKTVDNSMVRKIMKELGSIDNTSIEAFYVNYMPVKNGVPCEDIDDIKGADEDFAIERVIWSSLLPYNNEPMTYKEFIEYMNTHDVGEDFQKDLSAGVYDGMNLDGGFINNSFIPQILDHNLDYVVIMGYNGTKKEYLENLKRPMEFPEDRIIYIASVNPFKVTDTYMFRPDFLSERFEEGYRKGMEMELPGL